ncbi:MAG TPA: aldehyde dehydrogenase family protein [Polyangia bacterium]
MPGSPARPADTAVAPPRTPPRGTIGPAPLRIENPGTGALLQELASATSGDVSEAVARARAAQPAWARLSVRERGQALRRVSGRLLRVEEVIETIVRERGKPRYEAEGIEVFYTCELTRFLTGRKGRRALADDVRRPFVFAYKRARVVQHPHGVVGVIGPWNWPLLNNYADCVAPLLAGNAVVLKPSQVTPLTSLRIQAIWRELGLPPDVFQVLPGGAEVGEALVEAADMVFFTGSEAAGRKVARRCGERLIPCVLELGGKSPFIVLADADVEAAARALVWGSFANSGQVCVRPERVLVEAPVADRFTAACAAAMERLRQDPDPGGVQTDVDVGAMTFRPQIAHVEALIQDAVAGGARVLRGGSARGDLPGRFFAPTLISGATSQMRVMREEVFGPVLAIAAVDSAEQAIAMANEGGRGLSGSVWSGDAARARAVARRLETGAVCVNDVLVNYFVVEAPLGGVKGSGLGFRHGPEALKQFCRSETILENAPVLGRLSNLIRDQLGFPYQLRVLKLFRRLMRWLY